MLTLREVLTNKIIEDNINNNFPDINICKIVCDDISSSIMSVYCKTITLNNTNCRVLVALHHNMESELYMLEVKLYGSSTFNTHAVVFDENFSILTNNSRELSDFEIYNYA